MPLQMPFGDTDQGFIPVTLTVPPAPAALQTPAQFAALNQTIALTSDDPNTVTITLDATTIADPDGTVNAAPFVVATPATPAAPNTPIGVHLVITNADGSVAAKADDTVTVTEAVTEATGFIFGTPVAVTPPASAKRK
jgi:hypothetical protein